MPCSDHEGEWQQLERLEQLERMEQLNAEWHQQLAGRSTHELLLPQPTPGQRGTAQEESAETQVDAAAALPPLPSPINDSTADLDGAMARLLASAGNTPTGPLGLGLRSTPAHVFGAAAAEQGG